MPIWDKKLPDHLEFKDVVYLSKYTTDRLKYIQPINLGIQKINQGENFERSVANQVQ